MNTNDPTTATVSPDSQPPVKRHHRVRWTLIISGAVLAGIIAAGAAGGAGHPATLPTPTATSQAAAASTPTPAATPSTPTPAASTPAPAAPTATPAAVPATTPPAAPATTPAPADTTTAGQQQALNSAQSYLDLGSGFSRAGLIGQLTSQYGEGFSLADATWAVNNSGADWNAQAVMSAKGYMALGTGFSRAGLIDQLTSQYGEQFTLAQASYAVSQVGL